MNTNEAIQIANRWLGYLALQKARSERMQELARLARTDHKEAQRQMRQLDQQPHVFDGAVLEPAVRGLLAVIEKLQAQLSDMERAYLEEVKLRLEKEAQIDALMLEFCPDEMTPEQMERWGKNQAALNTEAPK